MDKATNATRYEDILKNIEHAERRVNKYQLDLNLATLGMMKLQEIRKSLIETEADKPDKLTDPSETVPDNHETVADKPSDSGP